MIEVFDTTSDGQVVHKITIGNKVLSASILTYGIALQDVRLAGVPHSLTLGFPTLTPYEGSMFHAGTLMGPVANRIKDAYAEIDGKIFHFDKNFQKKHTLHSGRAATHAKIWSVDFHNENKVVLSTPLPDGEGGFPGNRHITATFSITQTSLSLELTATTDAPTLMNLANHSYWNLGPDPTTRGHSLTVAADHYLPGDPVTTIPTGAIEPVENTRFDYRTGRQIEAGNEGLLDLNFCLQPTPKRRKLAAGLTGPTGISMALETTAPGLQVFDGHSTGTAKSNSLDGTSTPNYAGLALEAQFWPNAPHNPEFPDITLRPNQTWHQHTIWAFSKG